MGTDEDIILALVSALPSLSDSWAREGGDPVIDAGTIARHVITVMVAGRYAEIKHFFELVEELLVNEPPVYRIEDVHTGLLVEAPDECGAVLGTGLIEGIQNMTLHDDSPVASSAFVPYLGPRTLAVWRNFHEMWGTSDN